MQLFAVKELSILTVLNVLNLSLAPLITIPVELKYVKVASSLSLFKLEPTSSSSSMLQLAQCMVSNCRN